MRISTIGYSVKQGVKNIGRNKMFSLASIATMSACIFVFGLFFAIVMNFQYIVHKAEEGVAITVFFEEDATEEQIADIKTELLARDDVSKVNYISADDAWESFKDDYFGEDAQEAAEGFKNDNPLATSDSYEVFMDDVASQKEVVEFAKSLPGVRKVNKSDLVANTLNSINRLIYWVSAAIIASGIAAPTSPISTPSKINGARTKLSFAPIYFIIAISSRRTVIPIVTVLLIRNTDTASKMAMIAADTQ